MASKEISAIKTEIDDPALGITTNGAQRITAIVLNPFLTDMLNASKITTVADHATLKAIADAGGLIPGHGYKFGYIPKYKQNVTNTIKTGASENIILVANSTSTFHRHAASADHPEDIIEFDFTNILCEDFSTARGGKITYREDTINKLSYPGDFRAILNPFWIVDKASFPTWTTSTFYTPGVIVNSGGVLYRCRIMHTAGTFATDLANYDWENVDRLHGAVVWGTTVSMLGGTNNIYTSGAAVELSIFSGATNCHIKGTNPISSVRHVAIRNSNHVLIGEDSDQVIVYNSSTVPGVPEGASAMSQACDMTVVGHNSSQNLIVDGVGNTIGNNSSGIFKGIGSKYNKVGNAVVGMYIGEGCNYNSVGDNSTAIYIHNYSHYNSIGAFAQTIMIDEYTKDCSIKTSCANIILRTSSNNTFEAGCHDIKLRWAQYNNFGDACSTISNNQTEQEYAQFSYNTFGDGCSSITLGGVSGGNSAKLVNCVFGTQCTGITVNDGAFVSRGSFGNGCSTISIGVASTLIDFSFGHDCTNITLGGSITVARLATGNACSSLTFQTGKTYSNIVLATGVQNKTFASLNQVHLAIPHSVTQTWTVDIANAVINTLDSVNNKLGYITVASGVQTLVQI